MMLLSNILPVHGQPACLDIASLSVQAPRAFQPIQQVTDDNFAAELATHLFP